MSDDIAREAAARRGSLYRIEVMWSEARSTLVVAVLLGLCVWRYALGETFTAGAFLTAALVWTVLSGTSSVKDSSTTDGTK